jgi:hypothetical protein
MLWGRRTRSEVVVAREKFLCWHRPRWGSDGQGVVLGPFPAHDRAEREDSALLLGSFFGRAFERVYDPVDNIDSICLFDCLEYNALCF